MSGKGKTFKKIMPEFFYVQEYKSNMFFIFLKEN
jgi:hypothetical protein